MRILKATTVILLTLLAYPVVAGDPELPTEVQISLSRTPCYGPCPVYSVQVDGSGLVRFEGIEHVASLGKHEARVDPAIVRELVQEIEESGFMGQSALECGYSVTDNASALLTVRLGNRENSINHYLGCFGTNDVHGLHELERRIDELLNTNAWIHQPEP